MSRLIGSCVLLLAVNLLAAADDKKPDDAVAADLKASVGKWKIKKAVLGGKDVANIFDALDFEILPGGKYTMKLGQEKEDGSFTVDPSKTPKEIDIKSLTGPNEGRTIKGIYKFDGDDMIICYELGGKDRPAKFESKAETKQFLATYTRDKK